MSDLIPLLQDLFFRHPYDIPQDFALRFVAWHGGDWRQAQDHWERIVRDVLNTDAVQLDATGSRAIEQAVKAAAIVFRPIGKDDKCPLCSIRELAKGGTHGAD